MNPPTTRVAVQVGGWLTVLGTVPPLLLALWFAAQDAGQQGEFLDGVGLAVAGLLVAVAAVPALVGWVALHRWRERSRDAAWLLAGFGLLVALVGWPATGAVGLAVGATMVLGGLLVAAVAFLGLVVAPHEGAQQVLR